MQDDLTIEQYEKIVAHWKANAAHATRSKRETRRWLRRYKAKAKGRGETIRRFLREPARCAYCGETCGFTREELAHHVVSCEAHPSNRMAWFLGALLQTFDDKNAEYPRRAIFRTLQRAADLLRGAGGEIHLATAVRLERFIEEAESLIWDTEEHEMEAACDT